jgi:hypothetical protein
MCLSEYTRQANIDLGQDLGKPPLHDSGKESRIVQLPFGQSKLEGLSSSHPRQRKGRQRRRARQRERERVRGKGKCHLKGFPKVDIPSLGHHCRECPTG